MLRKCLVSSLVVALTVVHTLPLGVEAQVSSGQAVASVTMRTIRADGSTSAYARTGFEAGETSTSFLFAADGLCGVGMSNSGRQSLDDLVADNAHVWRVSGTAFEYVEGKMGVDLDWAHFAGSSASPVSLGSERLMLMEDQRHVLDLVRAPGSPDDCSTTLLLDVEAGVRDEASAVDRLIEYDLWLVHTDPSGHLQSKRIITTGAHGMQVPFAFGGFRFPVPRISADQDDFDVMSRVTGHVRGRIDPDGSVAVELLSGRQDQLGRRGDNPAGGTSGEGRKALRLAPGDAIEVEMPARGIVSQFASAQAAAAASETITRVQGLPGAVSSVPPPVSIVDGRIRVSYREFFEGHKLALLVQARALN